MGFDASVRDTQGHPMVVGHDNSAPDGVPHVLFYGHYDVQPADPLELWDADPFAPALVKQPDGETWITGRGASDDKGAFMTFIEACRAWKAATGALPCRVTVLLEGEEEIASPLAGPLPGSGRQTSCALMWPWSATPTCGTTTRRRSPP